MSISKGVRKKEDEGHVEKNPLPSGLARIRAPAAVFQRAWAEMPSADLEQHEAREGEEAGAEQSSP